MIRHHFSVSPATDGIDLRYVHTVCLVCSVCLYCVPSSNCHSARFLLCPAPLVATHYYYLKPVRSLRKNAIVHVVCTEPPPDEHAHKRKKNVLAQSSPHIAHRFCTVVVVVCKCTSVNRHYTERVRAHACLCWIYYIHTRSCDAQRRRIERAHLTSAFKCLNARLLSSRANRSVR